MEQSINLKEKIKKIIAKKEITLDLLSQKLDISKAGLYNIMNNNDCKLSTLFTLSKVLNVPIEYFVLNEFSTSDYKTEPTYLIKEDSIVNLQNKLESCRELNQRIMTELFETKDELVKFKRRYYKEENNNG